MKICIFGAGSIGGMTAALLSQAGYEVSVIARGEQLKAIKKNGLTLKSKELNIDITERIYATNDPREIGVVDLLIIALKSHSAAITANNMKPLLGDKTVVIPAVNGVPWWYFYGLKGPYEDHKIKAVDPGNCQWNIINPRRVIGCVVYPAANVIRPGIIQHIEGTRMLIGEPSGVVTDRCVKISEIFKQSGYKSPIRKNIRQDIWLKLWGNLSFNPVSLLTRATLEDLANDEGCKKIIKSMMQEAELVANALGINFPIDVDKRIDGTRKVGQHKTSTLQDLELGRPVEIDALTLAVSELGKITGIETPNISYIYNLAKMCAKNSGCYPRENNQ